MARSRIGAVLFIAALIAGCTVAATGGPGSVPASGTGLASPAGPGESGGRPSIAPVSLPAGSPGVGIVLPPAVLDRVLADAASRSGVPIAELVVVSATSRTWPDGSLGCPEPGMMYTQIVLEGYQVTIRADTTLYDYRGAGMTSFKLCKAIPG